MSEFTRPPKPTIYEEDTVHLPGTISPADVRRMELQQQQQRQYQIHPETWAVRSPERVAAEVRAQAIGGEVRFFVSQDLGD